MLQFVEKSKKIALNRYQKPVKREKTALQGGRTCNIAHACNLSSTRRVYAHTKVAIK